MAARDLKHDAIYVSSAGATGAGVALGKALLGLDCPARLICPMHWPWHIPTRMADDANAAAERMGLPHRIAPSDLDADESYVAPGYGLPSPAGQEAMHMLSTTEAILTDHLYTAKALAVPTRPDVPNTSPSASPIDGFIRARLQKEGLKPSPQADKLTLIRRVTLDLTGLPPSPAEVDAFLKDNSPDAYEKLVDRLLASPRYGERMAIRWCDAARYADTCGYQQDGERIMWRWRDWVIDA